MGVLLNHHPLKNRMFHEINQPSIYILCIYIYKPSIYRVPGYPHDYGNQGLRHEERTKALSGEVFRGRLGPGDGHWSGH